MNTGGVSLALKRDRRGCRLGPHLELKVRPRLSISTAQARPDNFRPSVLQNVPLSLGAIFSGFGESELRLETQHHSRLKLIVRLFFPGASWADLSAQYSPAKLLLGIIRGVL